MGNRDKLLAANQKNINNNQNERINLVDDFVVNEQKEEPVVKAEEEYRPVVPVLSVRKKPETKEKAVSLRLYPKIYSKLTRLQAESGLSLNEVVNQILAQAFDIELE